MALQLDTLFERDAAGRLRAVRSTAPVPVPRVFLGRTLDGNVWAVRRDLPRSLAAQLDALLACEPVPVVLDGTPPQVEAELRARLAEHAPALLRWQGPAFRFPAESPASAADPLRPALARADAAGLARFAPLADDALDAIEPCVLALDADDRPVAACHAARRGERACEAGVETLPEARGRGHARAVVAAWARAVRAGGREPLYSTSWDNLASRGVARSLGLIPYGEDWHLT